jgi:hypothetical protein
MKAEVTISLDDLDELRQARDKAERRAAEYKAQLLKEELDDPSGKVPKLVACIQAAMPIVQFAVANLDPSITRNWPYEELAKFAEVLDKMPGVDELTKEFALEFRNFAREIKRTESDRRSRDLNRIKELESKMSELSSEAKN